MHFETYKTHHHTTTPNRQDSLEILQKAKLGSRIEHDEDHISQISTLHSLGNLDEHATPEKTPTSGTMKNLVASAEERLGLFGDTLSRESSIWKDGIKKSMSGIKGKVTEKFGAKVDAEKDLDIEVKEQIKEINEEIKQLPQGEEEIVERQGKGSSKKQILGKREKKVKRKISTQGKELKQKATKLKKGFMKVYEVKSKVKENFQAVVEQVQEAKKKEVEETEVSRKSSGSGIEDLKSFSKDIMSKALGKIDEMRDKASHSTHLVREQIHDISYKSSDKSAELKVLSSSGPSVDELIDMSKDLISILDEALGKVENIKITTKEQKVQEVSENRGEIYNLTREINEILDELKSTDQVPYEKMTTSSQILHKASLDHHQLSKESPSFLPTKESHDLVEHELILDHHNLNAESRSFKPTKKSHILMEKVVEGLEESIPLTKIVEEVEHKKGTRHHSKGIKSRPLEEKCYMLMENVGGGLEELAPLVEKVEEVEIQEQSSSELSSQLHEISQEGLDRIHQCIEDAFSRLSEQAENAKKRLEALVEEDYSDKESSEGKDQSNVEIIRENIHEVSEKIVEKVQEVKESVKERREEGGDKQEEVRERQPLVDKIMNRIHAVSDNIHQRVENVKKAIKIEDRPHEHGSLIDVVSNNIHQRVENVKQAIKIEDRPHEHGPFIDVVSEKIHKITSKLPHHKETIEEQVQPSYEEEVLQEEVVVSQDQQEAELPFDGEEYQYHSLEDSKPSLREKISQKVGNLKNIFRSGKEEVEEEQEEEQNEEEIEIILDGIPETMNELKDAQLCEPLLNKEPIEALVSQDNVEVMEEELPRIIITKIAPKEALERLVELGQQEDHSLRERISEGLHSVSAKIIHPMGTFKGKFSGARRQEDEEVEALEESVEPVEEKEEKSESESESELESESLEDNKPSLRERVSGKVHGISNKISEKVDNLTSIFRSGREEVEEEQEKEQKEERLDEEDVEVLEESEEKEEKSESESGSESESESLEDNKPSLRERVSGKVHGISNKISQKVSGLTSIFRSGKEEIEEEQEIEQKEEEFHVVKDGIDETVGELKEEERVEALLSNNPFEPLASGEVEFVQPLGEGEIVGGNLEKLTAEETPGFKVEELEDDSDEEEVIERKSMFHRIMDSFMSSLTHHKNKENTL